MDSASVFYNTRELAYGCVLLRVMLPLVKLHRTLFKETFLFLRHSFLCNLSCLIFHFIGSKLKGSPNLLEKAMLCDNGIIVSILCLFA